MPDFNVIADVSRTLTYDVRVVDLDTRTSQGRVPVASREIRPAIAEAQP